MRRVLLCVALLCLATGAWLVVRGLAAQRHLQRAHVQLGELRDRLGDRDAAAVSALVADIQAETARARELTSDPVWAVVRRIPVLGRSAHTAAGITAAIDVIAQDALPELSEVAEQLEPRLLRPRGDRIDVDRLRAAEPTLSSVVTTAEARLAAVRRLPASLVLPAVTRARERFLDELDRLHSSALTAHRAAALAPGLLGAHEPRRYLVIFLNNAEMRGSGGFFGGYALIEANRGVLRMAELGPNSDLAPNVRKNPVDLGPEYHARYDRLARGYPWQNGNLSPHFPNAARIWSALWQETRGTPVDGLLALDPPALSRILAATGPAVLPSGEQVTAGNVVELTESTAYARFDGARRDEFLTEVAKAVYSRVVSGAGSTERLLDAFGASAADRHVAFWSSRAPEQEVVEQYPLGGALPEAGDEPFLLVTTQAAAANKLDYWVRREIAYRHRSDGVAEIRIRLRNTAPAGLPPYVTGTPPRRPGEATAPVGRHRIYVSVFVGRHAGLLGAKLDGRPIGMESEIERGHPVFSTHVHVDAGDEAELVMEIASPGRGPLTVITPPLVVDDVMTLGAASS